MKIKKLRIMMLLSALSCAALLNGCGSSSKEGTTGGVGLVEEGTCIGCHSTTTDPVSGNQIVKEYANSIHNPANVPANTTVNANNPDGCQGCHGGGAQHNGVGPIPFPNPLASSRCIVCHTTAIAALFTTDLVSATSNEDFAGKCGSCHTGDKTGPAIGVGIHGANLPFRDDCVGCHNVGREAPPHRSDQIVSDNSGVRAITGVSGEFEAANRNNVIGYRSHHIYNGTGVDPQNAQCIACHLEGKAAAGRTVVTDPAYHMMDGKIHLRDGNSNLTYPESSNGNVHTLGADKISYEYAWDPAKPNHQSMDQFCMSCHNNSGAVIAYANMSSALHGMTAIPGAMALSPKNPFGDQLTNAYDQKVRPGVVNVYDQMNPGNSSHHAVRGPKYTGRTRAAGDPRASKFLANFTNHSGAGNARIHPNAKGVLTAYQLFGTYSSRTAPASGTGPQYPGSRTTIYDAGLFVANFMTLNSQTLGDDSSLHCGDCHSVGQWKPGSATAIVWNSTTAASLNDYKVVPTTVAIGAHGSRNEYMLRTSDGSDSLQLQSTAQVGTTPSVNGNYVCFLCHTQYYYGDNSAVAQSNVTYGTNAVRADFGHGGGIGPCNGNAYSGYGKKGTARYGVLVNGIATPSIGDIFAMSCAHCHNSGQQNFGGIHGATGTYMSYSTNGVDVAGTDFAAPALGIYQSPTDANGVAYKLNVTQKTSYRFMGGESIRYNGGATADKWESQTPSALHREGCYNLSQTADKTHLWNTTAPQTTVAGGTNAIVNNNGNDSAWGATDYTSTLIQGNRPAQNNATSGWGSCNHHQGSTTVGPTAPTRVIQRPLVY